jgi:hypothetical protein
MKDLLHNPTRPLLHHNSQAVKFLWEQIVLNHKIVRLAAHQPEVMAGSKKGISGACSFAFLCAAPSI